MSASEAVPTPEPEEQRPGCTPVIPRVRVYEEGGDGGMTIGSAPPPPEGLVLLQSIVNIRPGNGMVLHNATEADEEDAAAFGKNPKLTVKMSHSWDPVAKAVIGKLTVNGPDGVLWEVELVLPGPPRTEVGEGVHVLPRDPDSVPEIPSELELLTQYAIQIWAIRAVEQYILLDERDLERRLYSRSRLPAIYAFRHPGEEGEAESEPVRVILKSAEAPGVFRAVLEFERESGREIIPIVFDQFMLTAEGAMHCRRSGDLPNELTEKEHAILRHVFSQMMAIFRRVYFRRARSSEKVRDRVPCGVPVGKDELLSFWVDDLEGFDFVLHCTWHRRSGEETSFIVGVTRKFCNERSGYHTEVLSPLPEELSGYEPDLEPVKDTLNHVILHLQEKFAGESVEEAEPDSGADAETEDEPDSDSDAETQDEPEAEQE